MPSRAEHILCPVDFSGASTRAFHCALAVASWFDAEVTVLHVHRTSAPVAAFAARAAGSQPPQMTNAERDRLANDLRVFVNIERQVSVDVSWWLDEAPEVSSAITVRAAALQADMIVIGTHGQSGVRRLVLGSVAERVLRTAECAVLTVPPAAAALPAEPLTCARVLCPIDFSVGSGHALEWAVSIAHRTRATLTVAHIIELPPDVPDIPQADMSAYRMARFDQARAAMARTLGPHRGASQIDELILAGRAGREIVRLAAEQRADVIVMAAHGRDSISRLMFGSVTNHVVPQAMCLVLSVRARRADARTL